MSRPFWSISLVVSCKCDVIANGIINAAKEIGIQKPIVIRLQGTNVEKAKLLD